MAFHSLERVLGWNFESVTFNVPTWKNIKNKWYLCGFWWQISCLFLNLHYPLWIHIFSLILKSGQGHRYFQEKEEERAGRQVSDRHWGGMIWINLLVSSEGDTLNGCGVSSLVQRCPIFYPKSGPWGGNTGFSELSKMRWLPQNWIRNLFSSTRHVQWLMEKLGLKFPTRPLFPPKRGTAGSAWLAGVCAACLSTATRGRALGFE